MLLSSDVCSGLRLLYRDKRSDTDFRRPPNERMRANRPRVGTPPVNAHTLVHECREIAKRNSNPFDDGCLPLTL
jgi:hypothetical protein